MSDVEKQTSPDEQKLERVAQKAMMALGSIAALTGASEIIMKGDAETVQFNGSEGKSLQVSSTETGENRLTLNESGMSHNLAAEEISGVGKKLQSIGQMSQATKALAVTSGLEM